MDTKVYLDYAATTPVDPQVVEAMLPYLGNKYGNPSSLYALGQEAKKALEDAREIVATYIGASPAEVVFTGCGSESDNWAVIGTAYAKEDKGRHIITSAFEHHAVLEPAHFLEKRGWRVTYLRPGCDGVVDPDQVAEALCDDTVLVSIMHVNNEVGTVQPIAEIGVICRERGVGFHTDAVQSVGKLPVNVSDMNCDMLSMSAHKVYAPKGVGVAYIHKGTRLAKFMRGGAQEGNRRAGTHNMAGIIGFAKAIEVAGRRREDDYGRISELSDALVSGLTERMTGVTLNGDSARRVPHIVNVLIKGVEGESVLLHLDAKGVAVSTGSACSSGSLEPSHVLLAMDIPQEDAHGSLRVTIGRPTTRDDIDYLLEVLPPIIHNLREMSPLYRESERV